MSRLINSVPPVLQETKYVMEFTETELWYVRRALLDSSPVGQDSIDALSGAYMAMEEALGDFMACPFKSFGRTRIEKK